MIIFSDINTDDLLSKLFLKTLDSSRRSPQLVDRQSASIGNCDFEVDTCGWTQSDNDQWDWIRNSGSTPSKYTGPSGDADSGSG